MSEPLNPDDSVLVLIDHQVLSMSLMRTVPLETVKANNVALVKAAKILGIPSVWTSSTEDENKDWWLPELAELDPSAFAERIKRTGIVNSWDQEEFVRAIEATGRRTLIMAGTSNDGCLIFTALSAIREGYAVQAVVDAGGSAATMSEQVAFLRMAHEGVSLTSASTVIGDLAYSWQEGTGGALRQVLAELFTTTVGEFSLAR